MGGPDESFSDKSFGSVTAVGQVEPGDEKGSESLVDGEGPGPQGHDVQGHVRSTGVEPHHIGGGECLKVRYTEVHVEVVVGSAVRQSGMVGSVSAAEYVSLVVSHIGDQ